ncbi:hypothetical protein [Brevibacterium marinum]|uniref:Uncharacterized protein n=1 Tax=Brevibacterium marinum TaxID=418643 RepID=A0A846RXU7_9MICO|nr:hypothetical protein [Brevibacterium marinum]NJC56255.1 hypothetical protein [Brevibacterium marinum]
MSEKLIHTVEGLALTLKSFGDVNNLGQTSFDLHTTDPVSPRAVTVEVTQEDLEGRLRAIAGNHPEQAWGEESLTPGEAAGRLLTVHLEEVIDNLDEGTETVVISKDGIFAKPQSIDLG